MSDETEKLRPRLVSRLAAAALCATALALPGTALADAPGAVAPQAALAGAQAALDPEPGASAPVRDVTLALRDLTAALPRLDGADRRAARRLLARPTDSPDPYGDTWKVPEAPPLCSPHFCVHYVTTTDDAPNLTDIAPANGVPDFVESVAATAEYSYSVENGPLGWPQAKSDGQLGGSSATDVYLANVGPDGFFGYAATDPSQKCTRSCFAYLVLDDDFSKAEFGYDDPALPLRVTLAHEYNHVIQYGLDAFEDGWLFESTATWAEEEVFPADNDYLNYVRAFAQHPGTPLTQFDGAGGLKIYGAATFQHWLDDAYGPEVVVGSWLANADPADFAVAAVDASVRKRGGRGFDGEFARFAAASAEWRSAGGFPDAAEYPDVKRQGKLSAGGRPARFALDHTAYRLLDVKRARGPRLKLTVDGERGVATAIALVGRDASGAVTRKVKRLGKAAKGSVALTDPSRFERITAVVVNTDAKVRGYSRAQRDWIYVNDNVRFEASLGR